jgi:DNA-binding NtrC family response regulator
MKKVLIIDDEIGIRESLKLILSEKHELILCDNPATALDLLQNDNNIAVTLLDIKMPQVNGLDVLSEIKDKYPHVKVIMVTGYKSVDTAAEATSRGADGYIVKPFDSKEILNVVRKNI